MMKRRKKDPAAVELGRRGGLVGGPARAAKLTAAERQMSARLAAMARWDRTEIIAPSGEPSPDVPDSQSSRIAVTLVEPKFAALSPSPAARFDFGGSEIILDDGFAWMDAQPANSIHAIVTDPPYGVVEYTEKEKAKLRTGKGGVWRIPPSFDGSRRSPLPRFTVLSDSDREDLFDFFSEWARSAERVLVPGAHVVVASNPLLSDLVCGALRTAGLEKRGEIIRLVQTLRGGDRPKNAHEEFADLSVMPRSGFEPWVIFRKPLEGRVQDNLRNWRTGALRRISDTQPFRDVIPSSPTRPEERALSNHPSLKPQDFMRRVVRAVLPFGEGIVLDPFMGGGSTIAACVALGYHGVGIESDREFWNTAKNGIPRLARWISSGDAQIDDTPDAEGPRNNAYRGRREVHGAKGV